MRQTRPDGWKDRLADLLDRFLTGAPRPVPVPIPIRVRTDPPTRR